MAEITRSGNIGSISEIAAAEEILDGFVEEKQEVMWLAEFLTDDPMMACACVTDAHNSVHDDDEDGICHICVRSALDLQRMRIVELSSAYRDDDRGGQEQPVMSPDTMEFVVRKSDTIRPRLDSLCRFVLVLCGFQQSSAEEAAVLLGIKKRSVEEAYKRALGSVEVMQCQQFLESYGAAIA